jgi:hypothetical protein
MPAPDLTHLTGLSADQAQDRLEAAGWSMAGEGDWAIALADPSDAWAARIVPFDPAYRLFAEDVLAGPQNRWLPRMTSLIPLERDGYVVLMERLWPADETLAGGLCEALGIRCTSGYEPPPALPGPWTDDPDLRSLKLRIEALMANGARRWTVWGGADIRPGNVLAAKDGSLRIVDPIFIRGPKILQALRDGDPTMLQGFTRQQLQDFLTIRVFRRDEDRPGGADELRACLDRMEAW